MILQIDFLIVTLICFLLASQCKAWRDLVMFAGGIMILPSWTSDREYGKKDTWHVMDGLNNSFLAFPSLFILFKMLFPVTYWFSLLIFPLAWFYYYQAFIWSFHVFFREKEYREIKRVLKGYNPKNWF